MAPMAPMIVESIPHIRRMLLFISNVNIVLIIAILGISIMIGRFFVLVPSYISVIQIWKGALPILNNIIVNMRLLFLLSRVFKSMVYLFWLYVANSMPVISIVEEMALKIRYLILASLLWAFLLLNLISNSVVIVINSIVM